MIDDFYAKARELPATARLIIKKLHPSVQPTEIYRWVLACYDAATFQLVVIDQFLTFEGALLEVDNIRHLEEEGRL